VCSCKRAGPRRTLRPVMFHALAQTTDGFLWLGTAQGLYRFDGVSFERYEPFQLAGQRPFTLTAMELFGLLWKKI
jgi:ligand-binding sensor domain-containing protein